MKKLNLVFSILFVLSFYSNRLSAQTENLLGDKLRNVVQSYAAAYIRPVNNALGITLNSGLFTKPNQSSLDEPVKFRFYAGLKAFGFMVKDEDKKFNLKYIDTVRQSGQPPRAFEFTVNNAPTFFGGNQPGVAHYTDNTGVQQTQQTIGGIYRSDIAPFVLLHLEAGSIYGTDVMFRFLPSIQFGKLEDISIVGFGIKHSVSQYIPTMPVDISVQFAYQKVALNSDNIRVVNSDAKVFSLTVSKRFLLLDVYGGVQYDNLTTDIKYNYITSNDVVVPVEFRMEDINNTSGMLGIGLSLGKFYFNIDGNFGKYTVLTTGIGFSY